MTESERIRKVVDYYDVSVNKFSIQLGLATPQILYDVLKGKNGISKDLAEKITVHCSEVNPGWLLTGEGEMLNTRTAPEKKENSPEQRENIKWYKQQLEEKGTTIGYLIKQAEQKDKEIERLKSELSMLRGEEKKKEAVAS
jgi:hypothetical protein